VNYVKVESSQIAEVGYGEGHYGPETLGIKFPPNRKQLAAGETGSEYHYQNVSSRTHQALVAAPSIGIYFGQNIKNNPAYPYVKVEADPTHPAPTKKNGTEPPSLFTAAGGADVEAKGATDILSPGSALALIDSMADDLLFTPGAITDAQLAAGRQWYLTEAKKYDISTEPKRTELKRFARPLQKLRTGIEARAKELTGATKRKIAAIDAEKRRLVQIVGGIEDEVLRPLTEWESKEMTRVDEHAEALKAIRESILYGATETVTDLTIRLAWLEIQRKRDWQEFAVPAEHSINEEVSRVERLIDLADARDKEQSELAKLRSDAAARADADRLANAAKEAREQAERESKAAVEYAEQKRLAAEQETKRQAELAEQRAIETAAQAKRDQEQAIENERMRVAVEAKREREEAEARAADDDHRCLVNKKAIDAIAKHLSIEWGLANTIVSAIAAGLIPNITINY
jgi:hypothetical protein